MAKPSGDDKGSARLSLKRSGAPGGNNGTECQDLSLALELALKRFDRSTTGFHRRDSRFRKGRLLTKKNMIRLRGWAPKGKRLIDKIPQGHWAPATSFNSYYDRPSGCVRRV